MQQSSQSLRCGALIALVIFVLPQVLAAQETTAAKADTVSMRADTTAARAPAAFEEQILETIKIEAVVEKPSVTLIPKRAETEVGQVPFGHRSFDNELKEKPKIVSNYGQELESTKRIKKMKKVLAKETK